MPRVKAFALAVTAALALGGCAQLFEFNLFAGLDNPPAPSAADYTGVGGLDALGEDLNSPATVEALAAQPTVVQEILDDLEGYWDTGVDNEEDAQAAILYADLALKTSEGEELVNNLVDAVINGTLGGSTVAEILADIVPAAALADVDTFKAMVDALILANDGYLALGAWVYAGNDLPPGSLPGDVAQKALVAYTMALTVEAIMDHPVADTRTQSEAEDEMYLIATADPGADPALAAIIPDLSGLANPVNPIRALLVLAGMPVP
jgi:hypothetical protein